MIFADVVAEVVDAWGAVGVRGSESIDVGDAEHIRFADDTGGDGNGRDGGVKFCVGGGEEDFLKESPGCV